MCKDKSNLIQLTNEMFSSNLGLEVIEQINEKDNGIREKSLLTLSLGDKFYKKLNTGEFKGSINLEWVGSDKFLFNSDTDFHYITSSGKIIRPKKMYTNGGSIPKILRVFKVLSPWNYTPAYIIHDWIFAMNQCNYQNEIDFEESAIIMAECIKTLMEVGFRDKSNNLVKFEKNEDILYLLYLAIASPIAKGEWEKEPLLGECLL